MPFFDDAGIVRENHRGPVVGALAVFGDQVERMVAMSLAWTATLVPAALAVAFPALPMPVRLGLLMVSSLAVVPATGMLYVLAAAALDGDEVGVRAAVAALRSTSLSSLRVLAPLAALMFVVGWTAVLTTRFNGDLIPVAVVVQLALLLLLTCAMYWGPLLARVPGATTAGVLRGAAVLLWRRPGTTMRVGLASLVLAGLGVLTVAGLALAVPAALALVHVNLLDQHLDELGGRVK